MMILQIVSSDHLLWSHICASLESQNFHLHFYNFEFQVICWVFGEYGTADGQHSGSYITGKLCDVAEVHSSDDTVKAYAVTALMKIYAFEIAAGRKVDMLPEYQSFIEELSASHSTDLQQHAYELQAVIGLDAHVVESIMPLDASCEDVQIDKSLSFLNSYVQQSLENGAQSYIPEYERSGILNISSFRKQDHHEASTHSLRFEAYEPPKPTGPMPSRAAPVSLASSTELVLIPEPSHPREMHQTTAVPSVSDTGPSELKLRLDGFKGSGVGQLTCLPYRLPQAPVCRDP